MIRIFTTFVLTLFAFASSVSSARVTNPNNVPKKATLLSKVNSLTLKDGQLTSSRRVSPVPQLQCVGPIDICKLYKVDVMRCTNEGSDYEQENIQWACKASLPEEFKLGSTDVSCEGYESSDDPYVLKGSCGVEYKLFLTEKGEQKYGKASENVFSSGKRNKSEDYASYVFMLVFAVVFCIIVYSIWSAWRDDARRPRPRRPGPGGGGGGGGFDDDEPPPPYDPYPPRQNPPRKPPSQKTSRASSSRSSGGSQQDQGWRPGFWTGAMTGAAAGYLAGNRNRTQPETAERRPAGGLFGGGGGGSSWTRQPSGSGSGPTTPSYSSSRHESTGFGSTSRR